MLKPGWYVDDALNSIMLLHPDGLIAGRASLNMAPQGEGKFLSMGFFGVTRSTATGGTVSPGATVVTEDTPVTQGAAQPSNPVVGTATISLEQPAGVLRSKVTDGTVAIPFTSLNYVPNQLQSPAIGLTLKDLGGTYLGRQEIRQPDRNFVTLDPATGNLSGDLDTTCQVNGRLYALDSASAMFRLDTTFTGPGCIGDPMSGFNPPQGPAQFIGQVVNQPGGINNPYLRFVGVIGNQTYVMSLGKRAPAPAHPFARAYALMPVAAQPASISGYALVDPTGQMFVSAFNAVDGIASQVEFSGKANFDAMAGTWVLPNAVIYTGLGTIFNDEDLDTVSTVQGSVTGTFSPQGTLTFTIASPHRPAKFPVVITFPTDPAPVIQPTMAGLAGRYRFLWNTGRGGSVIFSDFTISSTGQLQGVFRTGTCPILPDSQVTVADSQSRIISATVVVPDCGTDVRAGTYQMVAQVSQGFESEEIRFTGADSNGQFFAIIGQKLPLP